MIFQVMRKHEFLNIHGGFTRWMPPFVPSLPPWGLTALAIPWVLPVLRNAFVHASHITGNTTLSLYGDAPAAGAAAPESVDSMDLQKMLKEKE